MNVKPLQAGRKYRAQLILIDMRRVTLHMKTYSELIEAAKQELIDNDDLLTAAGVTPDMREASPMVFELMIWVSLMISIAA